MRLVIQRVSSARVLVEGAVHSEIGKGVLVLLGIGHGDQPDQANYLAVKTAQLRIFEDSGGKTNLSLLDVAGEALVVSQFTLYADTRKGRRPSFIQAAPPEAAEPIVAYFVDRLAEVGVPTQGGVFGAHMQIELVNDGPMTIILER